MRHHDRKKQRAKENRTTTNTKKHSTQSNLPIHRASVEPNHHHHPEQVFFMSPKLPVPPRTRCFVVSVRGPYIHVGLAAPPFTSEVERSNHILPSSSRFIAVDPVY